MRYFIGMWLMDIGMRVLRLGNHQRWAIAEIVADFEDYQLCMKAKEVLEDESDGLVVFDTDFSKNRVSEHENN
jgi:hypothetical protein